MPGFYSITPDMQDIRHDGPAWKAKELRLTNVERYHITKMLPFDSMTWYDRFQPNSLETKMTFLMEQADGMILNALINNPGKLKLRKIKNDYYISPENCKLEKYANGEIIGKLEDPTENRNLYDITTYNSYVTAFRYNLDGKLEIEIKTQNYEVSEFPLFGDPADPLAFICQNDSLGQQTSYYKMMFKKNLTIMIKHRGDLIYNVPQNERIAIDTLREMITETEYRKYAKHGFILISGKSGKIYQIFRNRSHTKVWQKGKLIEEICVRIKDGKIPPTDNLIAFKTMIETDEDEFRKLGNVYKMNIAA